MRTVFTVAYYTAIAKDRCHKFAVTKVGKCIADQRKVSNADFCDSGFTIQRAFVCDRASPDCTTRRYGGKCDRTLTTPPSTGVQIAIGVAWQAMITSRKLLTELRLDCVTLSIRKQCRGWHRRPRRECFRRGAGGIRPHRRPLHGTITWDTR